VSLRIIAGRHRGRRIVAPAGLAVRPTSDRAREALFAILEHATPPLRGARFLDLFAGSGAAALEAVSRGAAEALCVDQASAAVAAIRANVAALGETDRVSVLRADVNRLGRAPHPFDIAFLDPPYGSGFALPAVAAIAAGGWVAPGALVVAEIAARDRAEPPQGWAVADDRRYGAARFLFLRAAG
jgi:16S rRNA (guanine966-N2)-methyltransferase